MTEIRNTIKLEDLKKPITPVKWRIQHKKNGWAICVPYIDSRQAQDRLDEVCGMDGWCSEHFEVKGNLYCKVGINTLKGWIFKSDVGTESKEESIKGESSDSFKRGCVMWGIGRFLYSIKPRKLPTKKDGNGKEWVWSEEGKKLIYNSDTLTKYINWLENNETKSRAKKKADEVIDKAKEDQIKNMKQYSDEK